MAATVSRAPIDMTTPANYPIRLGTSIIGPKDSTTQYTSIRFNHKPRLPPGKYVQASVKAATRHNGSVLDLKSGEDKYGYEGRTADVDDSYVLVVRGEGAKKEAILERLSGCHAYNLVKTSTEDETKLQERYPQIDLDEGEGDDLFGGEVGEEPLDPENPYDYRHFLKAAAVERAQRPKPEAPRSTTSTPKVQPRATAARGTTIARPGIKRQTSGALLPAKKRKVTTAPPNPDPKSTKTSQKASTASNTTTSSQAAPPKIRVDRKASLRRSSLDDLGGELILENETPSADKTSARHTAMTLALTGQLGGGPRSLHSTASTPASQVASPFSARPDEVDEGGEFEIGGGDHSSSSAGNSPHHMPSHESVQQRQRRAQEVDLEEDADAEHEDEDADVEDFVLPSPAAEHRPSISAATVMGGEEDDMEAMLAAAMAEEEESEEE